MSEAKARVDGPAPSDAREDRLPSELADEGFADDKELVARASLARRRGENDESGVKALIRRAARRHRAALERLAREVSHEPCTPAASLT